MKVLNILTFILIVTGISAEAQSSRDHTIKEFDQNGNVKGEYHYKNGKRDGDAKEYNPQTGTIKASGKYKADQKQGQWQYFKYPNGNQQLYEVLNYDSGKKSGPYICFHGDTLEKGNYDDNVLSGHYSMNLYKIDGTGDTLLTPIMKGLYENGIKNGTWQFYQNGKLVKQGPYNDGKKNMLWRYYDKNGDLMKEMRYQDDVKEGKFHIYFVYKDGKKDEIQTVGAYHHGKLNGDYKKYDNLGIIAAGEYSDGQKLGKWMMRVPKKNMISEVSYFNDILSGPVVYKDQAGNKRVVGKYLNGKKDGTWTYFDKSGNKTIEENYKNNKLNGTRTIYNSTGGERSEANFENGKLKSIKKSNSSEEFDLHYKSGGVEVDYHFTKGDTTYYRVYTYKTQDSIKQSSFPLAFRSAMSQPEKCYPDGSYEKYINNNTPVLLGYFSNGKKDGLWQYMYSKQVLWKAQYSAGTLSKENFIDNTTKQPFKGEYLVNYPNGKPRFDFKIKDGLRNGKSRWYDEQGNEVKESKYKDGVKVK